MNSLTFLTGSCGCTANAVGTSATMVMVAKSLIESYGSFLIIAGLMTWAADTMSRV